MTEVQGKSILVRVSARFELARVLQNPGCLSGEIMTRTKKRKAIERVRGYKSSKLVTL